LQLNPELAVAQTGSYTVFEVGEIVNWLISEIMWRIFLLLERTILMSILIFYMDVFIRLILS